MTQLTCVARACLSSSLFCSFSRSARISTSSSRSLMRCSLSAFSVASLLSSEARLSWLYFASFQLHGEKREYIFSSIFNDQLSVHTGDQCAPRVLPQLSSASRGCVSGCLWAPWSPPSLLLFHIPIHFLLLCCFLSHSPFPFLLQPTLAADLLAFLSTPPADSVDNTERNDEAFSGIFLIPVSKIIKRNKHFLFQPAAAELWEWLRAALLLHPLHLLLLSGSQAPPAAWVHRKWRDDYGHTPLLSCPHTQIGTLQYRGGAGMMLYQEDISYYPLVPKISCQLLSVTVTIMQNKAQIQKN